VIRLKGTIITNLSGTVVVDVIQEVIESQNPPRIVFDLTGVTYLDSYSFGWITKVYKQVADKKGSFVVSNPNEDIRYLFEMTNFVKIVPVYPTVEDAREALLTGNTEKRLITL
jgi:anti-anti-sigma factor